MRQWPIAENVLKAGEASRFWGELDEVQRDRLRNGRGMKEDKRGEQMRRKALKSRKKLYSGRPHVR